MCSESLDMFGEEESDVLHQLLAARVIVAGDLQGGEDFVQETLVQVDRDQAEEVSVQQGEDHVPQRLLDLGVQHVGRLLRVEVIEAGGHVDCGCSEAEVGQTGGFQLRGGGGEITLQHAAQIHQISESALTLSRLDFLDRSHFFNHVSVIIIRFKC